MDRVKIKRAANTVTVGCKLPNGLVLQLYQNVKRVENVPNGTRTYEIAEQVGEPITIHGSAMKFEPGYIPPAQLAGGYGLTPGVNRDFFEEWMKQNREHPAVKSGLIFAAGSQMDAMDVAKENAGKRSGLEQIDPAKHGVKGVHTSDVMKAA
jgi:hypothetical protein